MMATVAAVVLALLGMLLAFLVVVGRAVLGLSAPEALGLAVVLVAIGVILAARP
jgi:hypothetical protein